MSQLGDSNIKKKIIKSAPNCWNKFEIKLINCEIAVDSRGNKSALSPALEQNCSKYYLELVLNGRLSLSAALWKQIEIIFQRFSCRTCWYALVGNIVHWCSCLLALGESKHWDLGFSIYIAKLKLLCPEISKKYMGLTLLSFLSSLKHREMLQLYFLLE